MRLIRKTTISKFLSGGPVYYVNPASGKAYIRFDLARLYGFPFVADPNDENSGWVFNYKIADPTGEGNRPSTIGGQLVDPQLTYLLLDPEGRVVNTSGGSVILPSDNIQLVPLDNTWAFHPKIGWFLPNLDSGTITDADAEMQRNFLGNTLGWELAYNLPDWVVKDMASSTAEAMMQGAAGAVGGEALGTVSKYAPKVLQFISKTPRTAAAVGLLGLGIGTGYALNKDEIGEYLSNIDDDITDEDFLNMGGEEAIPDMLQWLGEHGYKITKSGNAKDPAEIKRSYFIHPNTKYIIGPQGFFYYEDIPFGAAALFKGLRNKKWFPWVLGTGYALGKGARIAYYNSPAAKAGKLVNYLLSKGYVTIKNTLPSYNVLTNLNNPQIVNNNAPAQMLDSAATVTPYGEDSVVTGDELNLDYYGWENDTAL